ncbi:hypothetical protein ROZALSC1DRAFT_30328 [Rozella allomycis CSF55]|uniref:TRAPP III complex, Trs85 domain-containing protein n=1 Tax=Rozella allomycis (strain CSF55) TaxID=988480 RepID=A0A075B4I3_ROZAC|nr:TRAPP III complex, Trs85 domain-containing protein [Rozella allomycis CSF55]RKP17913.1 hypothetical protein ROZALSC1DRAFT_30328 [Rozella allomycis CSF55]|eukprot:EPZ36377.1 TRAPP III complex, Trs85 domain-containing protein [Rozella allomycis CSF55]
MRRLADYSFFLGDYRMAQSTYDSVKRDYQTDKNWTFYASALDPKYLDSAAMHYMTKCNDMQKALCTSMLQANSLCMYNQFKDAAVVYLRMANEFKGKEYCLTALMYEQASQCYSNMGWKRKQSFYLYLAGKCFDIFGLTITDKGWTVAEDLINFGLKSSNNDSLIKLLRKSRINPALQQSYLDEFLSKAELKVLKVINESATFSQRHLIEKQIPSELSTDFTDLEAQRVRFEEWKRDGLIDPNTMFNPSDLKAFFIKELVTVEIGIENNLNVPIFCSNVYLICEFSENRVEWKRGENYEEIVVERIEIEPEQIMIFKGQIKVLKKGYYRVVGLSMKFMNKVELNHCIEKKGKRLNSTKEERMKVLYSQDKSLEILSLDSLPLISAFFHEIPEEIYFGQVVKSTLEITNISKFPISSLKFKTNLPHCIQIGSFNKFDSSFYSATEENEETFLTSNGLVEKKEFDIPLPAYSMGNLLDSNESFLYPGRTALIPVWLRGEWHGSSNLKIAFKYECEIKSPFLIFRTFGWSKEIKVLPTIKANAFTKSGLTCNQNTIGIEIENLNELDLEISQISCLSPIWKLKKIDEAEIKWTISSHRIFYFSLERNLDPIYEIEKEMALVVDDYLSSNSKGLSFKDSNLSLLISSIKNNQSEINLNSPFLKNFLNLSRQNWRLENLKNTFPHFSVSEFTRLFPKYFSDELDLIIFWNAGNVKAHHIIQGKIFSIFFSRDLSWISCATISTQTVGFKLCKENYKFSLHGN